MEYTLSISQRAIATNFPDLDIKDAGIIDFIGRFTHSAKIQKKIEGTTIYYWLDYQKIADENPLLKLGAEAIRKRVRKLCNLGIFVGHPLNSGGRAFFAFGENYELTHKYEDREENPEGVGRSSGRKSRGGREENPEVDPKAREENPDISNIPLDQKNQDQKNQATDPLKPKFKFDFPAKYPRFNNPAEIAALWKRWVDYRKARKPAIKTEDEAFTALKKLFEWTKGDVAACTRIVENSIARGWQGLFEEQKPIASTQPAPTPETSSFPQNIPVYGR